MQLIYFTHEHTASYILSPEDQGQIKNSASGGTDFVKQANLHFCLNSLLKSVHLEKCKWILPLQNQTTPFTAHLQNKFF
jgi:hypothetical protein